MSSPLTRSRRRLRFTPASSGTFDPARLTRFRVNLGHLEGTLQLCARCSPGGPATYWTRDLEELITQLDETVCSVMADAGLPVHSGDDDRGDGHGPFVSDAYFDPTEEQEVNIVSLDLTRIRETQESVVVKHLSDGLSPVEWEALETLTEENTGTASGTQSTTERESSEPDDDAELDPDSDGVGVFADRYLVSDSDGAIPKDDLYQAYSTWVAEHGLDGTNNVWFARKLSDHLDVGTDRRRVDGDRVNFYTGIALTEDGERLCEAPMEGDE